MASFSVRLPARHAAHRRAEQPHPDDVQRLPRHVVGAHVDVALEAEQRAHGGGRHAVLSGAGLGNDARLAHALGEQRLTERVVDLVRAGVREVFALQKDPRRRLRQRRAQPRRFVHRRRPADVVRQQPVELREERRDPAAPRDTPAAALRQARPASRERTCRHSRRSSRARSDRAGRIVCQSCSASKKRSQTIRIFHAGRRFHSRRHINAVRPHRSNSQPDVRRIQSAGENRAPRRRDLARRVPVDGLARSAVSRRIVRVDEQHDVGIELVDRRPSRCPAGRSP